MKLKGFHPGDRKNSQKLRLEYLKAFYSIFFQLKKVKHVKEAALLKMQVISLEDDLKNEHKSIRKSLSEIISNLSKQIDEQLRELSKNEKSFVYYLGDEGEAS